MGSNVGPALGIVADVFAKRIGQKQEQAQKETSDRFALISNMVKAGLSSGSIEDPNAAISFLLDNAPGKSGKGNKNGLPTGIQTLLGAITKAGGSSDHQMQGQMPTFLTADQMEAKRQQAALAGGDTEIEIGRRQRAAVDTDMQGRVAALRQQYPDLPMREIASMAGMKVAPGGGLRNLPGTTSGKDLPEGTKDSFGQPIDPAKSYRNVQSDGQDNFYPTETKAAGPRSHLTGEALQAYDMNQMLAGIDPETGKPPENQEDAARLQAAGESMKKARDLKNQATVVRINTGNSGTDDVKEVAESLIRGDLNVSQLGSMGGTQRNKVIAEANRLRRQQSLPPLNYQKMALDYYGAQRQIASLKGPQMTRFKGLGISVINTIDEVKNLAEQLQQGGVAKYNRAKRGSIRELYGNTPQSELANRYVTAVNTLKEEFASLAMGGYSPTEPAWKLANDQINTDYGVKDMTTSLDEIQRLIKFRLDAFDQLTDRGNFGLDNVPSGGNAGGGGDAANPLGLTRPGKK